VLAAGQRSSSPEARTIEGVVLDSAGKAVPGAVVLLEDLKSLQVRSYLVQQDGKYHFHGLSSDASYQLHARMKGLFSNAKTVTVFDNGRIIVVNLKLAVKKPRASGNPS
jgi:hypothetical protein